MATATSLRPLGAEKPVAPYSLTGFIVGPDGAGKSSFANFAILNRRFDPTLTMRSTDIRLAMTDFDAGEGHAERYRFNIWDTPNSRDVVELKKGRWGTSHVIFGIVDLHALHYEARTTGTSARTIAENAFHQNFGSWLSANQKGSASDLEESLFFKGFTRPVFICIGNQIDKFGPEVDLASVHVRVELKALCTDWGGEYFDSSISVSDIIEHDSNSLPGTTDYEFSVRHPLHQGLSKVVSRVQKSIREHGLPQVVQHLAARHAATSKSAELAILSQELADEPSFEQQAIECRFM